MTEVAKDTLVDMTVSVNGEEVGTMTFEFWPEAAPQTVSNFLAYVEEGFYNGKIFHRVIPDFMIQGGCPDGTGMGSGPRGTIPGEFQTDSKYTHGRGVISMARSQDPNSASCQFFVCHGSPDFLDGQYAAFGVLIAGEDVLDAVASVPCHPGGEGSSPSQECKIEIATLRSRNENE